MRSCPHSRAAPRTALHPDRRHSTRAARRRHPTPQRRWRRRWRRQTKGGGVYTAVMERGRERRSEVEQQHGGRQSGHHVMRCAVIGKEAQSETSAMLSVVSPARAVVAVGGCVGMDGRVDDGEAGRVISLEGGRSCWLWRRRTAGGRRGCPGVVIEREGIHRGTLGVSGAISRDDDMMP